MNLPQLPPGFTWDPDCGAEDLCPPKWRALGPKLNGRDPVELYARTSDRDSPEGCAEIAWAWWVQVSGVQGLDPKTTVADLLAHCYMPLHDRSPRD